MSRLIDTLNANELNDYLEDVSTTQGWLPYKSDAEVRQKLERLFAEEPQWFDGLDPEDNQTWVLCFVSDDSPKETWLSAWVTDVFEDEYVVPCRSGGWKYATPIDLNVRYKEGESKDEINNS
jgi:hypothetical protein